MKYHLIVLLATVASLNGRAQIRLGLKAGTNFANLIGPGPRTSIRVGFQGGALVAIPLSTSFTLQPEVNYSLQGNKSTEDGSHYTFKLNYLNVPVLIKYQHVSGLFAESGLQIGFLTSANISGGPGSGDVKSIYKTADLSWAFGIGYFVKSMNAGIDTRYNIDLTNDLASWYGTGGYVYSSVFQVGVFYFVGGGKIK